MQTSLASLITSEETEVKPEGTNLKVEEPIEDEITAVASELGNGKLHGSTPALSTSVDEQNEDIQVIKKPPRKLIDEEKRAVGRVARTIWMIYFKACGSWLFWASFCLFFGLASIGPVFENGWLRSVCFFAFT